MGRHMPREQPSAMTMAISAALVDTLVARPMPMGMRRFAEAECEMTFEVTHPTSASTRISRAPGIDAHWMEPSIHLSRPVAATPEPSAIPPATSHRTGQSRARRSSPLMTFVIKRITTGRKPTTLEEMWWSDSVIHSRIVAPATA